MDASLFTMRRILPCGRFGRQRKCLRRQLLDLFVADVQPHPGSTCIAVNVTSYQQGGLNILLLSRLLLYIWKQHNWQQ